MNTLSNKLVVSCFQEKLSFEENCCVTVKTLQAFKSGNPDLQLVKGFFQGQDEYSLMFSNNLLGRCLVSGLATKFRQVCWLETNKYGEAVFHHPASGNIEKVGVLALVSERLARKLSGFTLVGNLYYSLVKKSMFLSFLER